MVLKKIMYFITSLIMLSLIFLTGACARAQAPTEWAEYIELECKETYVKHNGKKISKDYIIYNNQKYSTIDFCELSEKNLGFGFSDCVNGEIIGKIYKDSIWTLVYKSKEIENPNVLYTSWLYDTYFREDLNIENWSIFDLTISAIGINIPNSKERENGIVELTKVLDFTQSKKFLEIIDVTNCITYEQATSGEIKLKYSGKRFYLELAAYKDVICGFYPITILDETGELYVSGGATCNEYKIKDEYQELVKNKIFGS